MAMKATTTLGSQNGIKVLICQFFAVNFWSDQGNKESTALYSVDLRCMTQVLLLHAHQSALPFTT
ncbi:hypothetical protein KC19_VG169300 [Ceratodon purpureus]|uniref:Uncharacterized protein n=1 Tax=Ceratodon purpureus TaxID=3225 RepID=A0A8T0HR69_CERPU|nr:hypothetical protein KC19_VG169300 [Ceratodon purpureus]